MPKRRVGRGTHPRRLGSKTARQLQRDAEAAGLMVGSYTYDPATNAETVGLPLTAATAQREEGQWATDPYAPVFGDTVVLASRMRCPSCDFDASEGSEATYIDGELNCAECAREARHPHG